MLVSIIIPVFNEEKTIGEILTQVKKVRLGKKIDKEIIVVNDASGDKTKKIIDKLLRVKPGSFVALTHKINRGKGGAIKTGLKKAKGDIVLIQDADLEYNPQYLPKIISPIVRGECMVVYGTRLQNFPLRLSGRKKTPLITHFLGNKFLSFITSILFGSNVSDMETGYKAFRKSVLKDINIKANRFDFEPEITAKILKRGYKIFEVPIKVNPRGYDEGKKITWRDGFSALKTLFKYRFLE